MVDGRCGVAHQQTVLITLALSVVLLLHNVAPTVGQVGLAPLGDNAGVPAKLVVSQDGSLMIGMLMQQHLSYSSETSQCSRRVGFEAAEDLETTRVMFRRLAHRTGAQVSLGFRYYDACHTSSLALAALQEMTLQLPLTVDNCLGFRLSGAPLRQETLTRFMQFRNNTLYAFLLESYTFPQTEETASLDIIPLMSLLGVPQLSHQEFDPSLDNKLEYPTYFRASPLVDLEARAINDILEYLQVLSFVVIASATMEEYARQIIQTAQKRTTGRPLCVAYGARFYYNDMKSITRIARTLQRSRVRDLVIVLLARSPEAAPLLSAFDRAGSMPNITWLGNRDWVSRHGNAQYGIFRTFFGIGPAERADVADDLAAVKEHFLSLRSDSPEFRDDVNLRGFWQNTFQCRLRGDTGVVNGAWPLCTGTEQLTPDNLPLLTRAPLLILALKALARAVDDTLLAKDNTTDLNEVLRHLSTQCPDGSTGVCPLFNRFQGPNLESLRVYAKVPGMQYPRAAFDWASTSGLTRIVPRTSNAVSVGIQDHLLTALISNIGAGTCVGHCPPGEAVEASNLEACCQVCKACSGPLQYTANYNSTQCYECTSEHTQARDDHTGCEEIPIDRVHWSQSFPIAATIVFVFIQGTVVSLSLLTYIRQRTTPIVATTNYFNSFLMLSAILGGILTIPLQFQAFELSAGLCLGIQLVPFLFVWATIGLLLDRSSIVQNCCNQTLPKRLGGQARTVLLAAMTVVLGYFVLGLRLLRLSLEPIAVQLDRFQRFQACGDQHWFTELSVFHIILMSVSLIMALSKRNQTGAFREAWLVAMSNILIAILWPISLAIKTAVTVDQEAVVYTATFCMHGAAIFYPLFAPRLYVIVFRPKDNDMKLANRGHKRRRKRGPGGRRYLSRRRYSNRQDSALSISTPKTSATEQSHHASTDKPCSPAPNQSNNNSKTGTPFLRRRRSSPNLLHSQGTTGASNEHGPQSPRYEATVQESSELASPSYIFTDLPQVSCQMSPDVTKRSQQLASPDILADCSPQTIESEVASPVDRLPFSPLQIELPISPAPSDVSRLDESPLDGMLRSRWHENTGQQDSQTSRSSSVHPPSSPESYAPPDFEDTKSGVEADFDPSLSKALGSIDSHVAGQKADLPEDLIIENSQMTTMK